MPIIFITLNNVYIDLIKAKGYNAYLMKIQDYKPRKDVRTYYISPANSLCFMDGGIDYALSRIIFPNIEKTVKEILLNLGIKNLVGKPYLPIGSSIIIDCNNKSLVLSPTMLLPQNVANTQNAYYATMAILYNILINRGENIDNVDIIFTSLCCGYGKMDEHNSMQQTLNGIRDYNNYKPIIINKNIIINEPNLLEQPKYYQNTEWFSINPADIKTII